MSEDAAVEALTEQLFSVPDADVFAVLDGASVPELRQMLWKHQPEYYCLFPGELEPDMAEVAPYVVKLDKGSPFARWVLAEGWGKHWGVFAASRAGLRQMRGHFRSLIDVYDADGSPLIFRYYDPRVMRQFLSTCQPGQLAEMFGEVICYCLEQEDPDTMLRYQLGPSGLNTREITLRPGKSA